MGVKRGLSFCDE